VVKAETGVGVDVAIDAVGSLIGDALQCTRRGARILLFGIEQRNAAASNSPRTASPATKNGFIGTYISNHFVFPPVIKLLESGLLPLQKLVSHRINLEQIPEGIEIMRSGASHRDYCNAVKARASTGSTGRQNRKRA